ncbi:MAG: TPM domain-containing protein [Sulfurifustaceae bacterium]
MNGTRLLRHLSTPRWKLRRVFPAAALANIEAAIKRAEASHGGQICFAVEAALEIAPLLRGHSARARALDVFAQLRVWDTEHNNGVLIYLLLADHDVEIVADRGVHVRVGGHEWERICRTMEQAFREGRFEQGVIDGINAVSAHLTRHYPPSGKSTNEIPDRPVVL